MRKLVHELIALTRGLFGWWFGELLALVPPALRRRFGNFRGELTLVFLGDVLSVRHGSPGGASKELARIDLRADPRARKNLLSEIPAKLRNTSVAIRLGPAGVLRKTLSLPSAASENLRQVLSFQMDRHTPFKADEVYFDHRIIEDDPTTQRIKVELIVVPQGVVHEALGIARQLDLDPRSVHVADNDPQTVVSGNLLPRDLANGRTRAQIALTAGLAVVALVLLAASIYVPLDQKRDIAASLDQQLLIARRQADAASKLEKEIELLTADSQLLVNRKRQIPASIEVVRELTRVLPDGTWLTHLQLTTTDVQITGFSQSASALIGMIEASPVFEKTEFRSPVTQDQRTGRERFHISAQVVRATGS